MKFATERPFANPEATARKLIEIANSVEAVKDGRIYIELINAPFLYEHKGSPAEYKASLALAITRGWLTLDQPSVTANGTRTRSTHDPRRSGSTAASDHQSGDE
jgi:hypothetical protein